MYTPTPPPFAPGTLPQQTASQPGTLQDLKPWAWWTQGGSRLPDPSTWTNAKLGDFPMGTPPGQQPGPTWNPGPGGSPPFRPPTMPPSMGPPIASPPPGTSQQTPGPWVGPSFNPAPPFGSSGGPSMAPGSGPQQTPGPWSGGPGPSVQPNFNPAFASQTKQKAPPIRPPSFLPPGPQMVPTSQGGGPTMGPRLDSLKPTAAWGKRPGQY